VPCVTPSCVPGSRGAAVGLRPGVWYGSWPQLC